MLLEAGELELLGVAGQKVEWKQRVEEQEELQVAVEKQEVEKEQVGKVGEEIKQTMGVRNEAEEEGRKEVAQKELQVLNQVRDREKMKSQER